MKTISFSMTPFAFTLSQLGGREIKTSPKRLCDLSDQNEIIKRKTTRKKKKKIKSQFKFPSVFFFFLLLMSLSSLTLASHAKENSFYSSSDSEDEDEPRKFLVEIKPVQPNNGTHQSRDVIDELKASVVKIALSPSASVRGQKKTTKKTCCCPTFFYFFIFIVKSAPPPRH